MAIKPIAICTAAIILACLGGYLGIDAFDKNENNHKVDGVSSASPKKIPPTIGDTYTILGKKTGLNGWIIQYDNGLIRGGNILDQRGMVFLKELGVKTIFSVTPTDLERELAYEYGVTLLEIEYQKDPGMTKQIVDKFLAEIDKNPGPYYIHCIGGADRGGALVGAYRLFKENKDIDMILEEFTLLGGHALQFPKLLDYLEKEGNLRKQS